MNECKKILKTNNHRSVLQFLLNSWFSSNGWWWWAFSSNSLNNRIRLSVCWLSVLFTISPINHLINQLNRYTKSWCNKSRMLFEQKWKVEKNEQNYIIIGCPSASIFNDQRDFFVNCPLLQNLILKKKKLKFLHFF